VTVDWDVKVSKNRRDQGEYDDLRDNEQSFRICCVPDGPYYSIRHNHDILHNWSYYDYSTVDLNIMRKSVPLF